MNKKELHKLCKGCRSYARITQGGKKVYHRSCMIDNPVISSNDQCPCINCILKVMCGHICEEYIDFNIREAKNRAIVGVLK